jgi:hypothetical protein
MIPTVEEILNAFPKRRVSLDDPRQLADAAAVGVDGVCGGRADLAREVFDRPAS